MLDDKIAEKKRCQLLVDTQWIGFVSVRRYFRPRQPKKFCRGHAAGSVWY
jgi:hypothetical protein